jgi:cell division protein ZapA
MGLVNTSIAGRQYRLACEDGQEEHLLGLAKELETRIIDLRRKFGEIGDTRLTVMAALMLADEGAEARAKQRKLEDELAAHEETRAASVERARQASDAVVGAFHSAAERIESITRKLNQTVGAPAVVVG